MYGPVPPLRSKIVRNLILAATVAAALHAQAGAAEAATCADAAHPGGDWQGYGHDYSNTRHQEKETAIGPLDAPILSPAWALKTEGEISGTPAVVDGCLYVGTTAGFVYAVNADTGEPVWTAEVPDGGVINASLYVSGGRVFAAVARDSAPYLIALDQADGTLLWKRQLDSQPGSETYASPVEFGGVLMIGISGGAAELGDETDRYAFQGAIAFVDATTGALLKKTWTIHPPVSEGGPEDDFAGAAVWSTPAVDPDTKTAYVGTGNPFRPQAEHPHANAILKLDVDRGSTTFGEIVDHYKGNIDEYIPELSETPCVDIPGNPPPWYPQGAGACGDIDLDFGAAPNLFRDDSGRLLVGEGQKSGVYHVVEAATMDPVWTQIVGPPTAFGGIVGSTAYDGHSIFGPVTVPGYLWSLDAADGAYRWFAPIADGGHWGQPVAVANGVVYTVDTHGTLDAYDAATGAQLAKHPLVLGTEDPVSISFAGVSVARNTVYAAVGTVGLVNGYVVAFRKSSP